jgi:sec-independent protein translocase protein TatC
VLILQCFSFIINGLYKYEFYKISLLLILSTLLLLLGFLLGYYIIIPNAWNFFLEFENNNVYFPLHFEAKLNNYLFFIVNLLLGIIICFQIPAFFFICFSFNLLKKNNFLTNRKLIYIISIFTGTLISSPDIFSQLFIFCIFIFSYEISFLYLFFLTKLKTNI